LYETSVWNAHHRHHRGRVLMPWLRITQGGNRLLVNSDRVMRMDEYAGVDPAVQTMLVFSPEGPGAVLPQELAVDQTLDDFSTALTAVSVGGV
jgi:hypothetical protein